MTYVMSKTKKEKIAKIISAIVVVVIIIGSLIIGQCRRNYLEDNGVYSICEYYNYRPEMRLKHDDMNVYYYYYNGVEYTNSRNKQFKQKPDPSRITRVYIVFMPDDPNNHFFLGRVPSWFVLDAPSEGWKTKPTETEMRDMMVQDSIKRGLK